MLPPVKPKNLTVRTREYLTPAEIKRLKEAARSNGRYSFRDWLLITIMYRHALRVGELTDLRWDQVDLTHGRLHVNRLKNGDSSVHYLEGDEIRSLRKLNREYPDSDFIFCSERQGPLTSRTVHRIIARAGEHAGLKFPCHPHMLRHAKGYQLASKGNDTRAIQAYLGHKNIQHTVLYTKLDPRRFKGFSRD
jgi:type 1 fimbriae regulatory protein FimB/type 1 fimbriae regulatory protein FimE